MKAVINASPLIFLGKLDMLHLLSVIYEGVYSTPEVFAEVLDGIEAGYADAVLIKKFVDEGKIRELKIRAPLEKYEAQLGLHRGEISVLLAARELKIGHVIVDDKRAIKAAKYFGLKPISTPFILLEALKMKKITLSRFKNCLDKLIDFGYRISPKLYMRIIAQAEGLAR
jgi:predicted nucleic acid-binding protein